MADPAGLKGERDPGGMRDLSSARPAENICISGRPFQYTHRDQIHTNLATGKSMTERGIATLTERQREHFLARLEQLGIPSEQVLGVHIDTTEMGGSAEVSGDLNRSCIPTFVKTLTCIQEKAELAGVPDSVFDGSQKVHVTYPPPFDGDAAALVGRFTREQLARVLGPEGQANVDLAHQAWLQGDSRRVQALGYEPLINALHFPQRGLVAAAESLTVGDGDTVTLGDRNSPTSLSYATITVVGTGQIICAGELHVGVSGEMAHQSA